MYSICIHIYVHTCILHTYVFKHKCIPVAVPSKVTTVIMISADDGLVRFKGYTDSPWFSMIETNELLKQITDATTKLQ